jgi:uncharacterized membrane protein
MANPDVLTTSAETSPLPAVRTITIADLSDALRKGFDDFWAMPTHAVFLTLIYPVAGLVLARAMLGYEIVPLLYPLAAGFALVGPLAAIGIYELSRRRELGLDTSWTRAFDIVHAPSFRGIVALALLLLVIFATWIAVAHAIYVAHFGYREPESLAVFVQQVLTTPAGHSLIVVGNAVGFLFAALVLTISAVSFPLLLDRNATAMEAIVTSVRATVRNPIPIAAWGLIVAVALLLGSLPLFFGLAIVLPVLGHATWHLYRKTVEPPREPRPEYRPHQRPLRSAADFPVALFPGPRADRP